MKKILDFLLPTSDFGLPTSLNFKLETINKKYVWNNRLYRKKGSISNCY